MALLEVQGLVAGYGAITAVKGISLSLDEGEIVTLIGSNGAGKSTTLRAISGLIKPRQGEIRFADRSIVGLKPHEIVALGLSHVPEGRGIFGTLTVKENLLLGAHRRRDRGVAEDLERVFALFPRLRERLGQVAGTLSGGEQQMLAIARILRTGARLLLLDEPTEGLAPVIVQQIGRTIRRLKREGFTILLVEQNFRFAATVADRHYVVEHGHVVDTIPNSELEAQRARLETLLGV